MARRTRIGRKAKKKAHSLALLAVLTAVAALGAGYYIEYRLRPYRIFHVFTSAERGWRDQAFEVALYSGMAAVALILAARLVRKL